MASVTGYKSDHMDALMDENVVGAELSGSDLIIVKRDGTEVNLGSVQPPSGADTNQYVAPPNWVPADGVPDSIGPGALIFKRRTV